MNYLRMKLKALLACADRFIGYLKTVTGYPCICDNGVKSVIQEYKICGNEGGVGNVNDEGTYDIPITVSGKNLFDESNDIVRKNTGDTGKLVIGGYNVHLIKNYYHSGNSIPTYTDSTTGTDGTNIFTIGVNLKAGGTYTASAKFLSDSGNKGQSISLVWRYTDGTVYGGWGTNQFFAYGNKLSETPQIGKVSFTPEKDIDMLQIQYFAYGQYVYMVKDTLQIEESSVRTAYEPYRAPYQYNIKLQHPLGLYDYLDNTGIAVHYDGKESFAAPVMQIGKGTNIITAETDVKPSNIEATYYNTEVQDEV